MKVRCFSVSFADTRKVMRERPLSLLDTIEVREKKKRGRNRIQSSWSSCHLLIASATSERGERGRERERERERERKKEKEKSRRRGYREERQMQ